MLDEFYTWSLCFLRFLALSLLVFVGPCQPLMFCLSGLELFQIQGDGAHDLGPPIDAIDGSFMSSSPNPGEAFRLGSSLGLQPQQWPVVI